MRKNSKRALLSMDRQKTIFVLSTNSTIEITSVKRRSGSVTSNVNCLLSFAKCNKRMGGVDLAD